MKEIHAYQNEDGTYRVETRDVTYGTTFIGEHEFPEMTEYKTEIPRAKLHIEAIVLADDENKLITLTLDKKEDRECKD